MNRKSLGQKTKTKPRLRRPQFIPGSREELDHLYHKLLDWFYGRANRARARVYSERLAKALAKATPDRDAIFIAECRSLIAEVNGDLAQAIAHRENEIRLIRRLHELARNSPQKKLIFQIYGYGDLADRLDLLGSLYHDKGDLTKARSILHESRDLCRRHGIPFDGQDILDGVEEEIRSARAERNGVW